jgi:hypothetical protein
MSASVARRSTSSGTTGSSQIRASAGIARGVLVAAEDIVTVRRTDGCRARMRTSSWPA